MVVDTVLNNQGISSDEALAYFYCRRDELAMRDPEAILRAVVEQLGYLRASYRSTIQKLVIRLYQAKKDQGFSPEPLGFQESLELIISLVGVYSRTTIVIDALDEIDRSKRQGFLDSLVTIIESSKSLVKIFVTSREDRDIVLRFENVPNINIGVGQNSGDIEAYVRAEVDKCIAQGRLLRGVVTTHFMETVIATLIKGAHGMYML